MIKGLKRLIKLFKGTKNSIKMEFIRVGRNKFNPDWTISNLYISGEHDGFAVEDEIREVKVFGETAVDYGVYDLGFRQSPKFSKSFLWSDKSQKLIDTRGHSFNTQKLFADDWRPHDLIWVKGTPRHEFVLIHWGNTDDNTDGCLIVGRGLGVINGQEGVVDSRKYYIDFYQKVYPEVLKGGKKIEYVKENIAE